ncbi:MAG: hypothetical protein HMLKMBBP_03230 [Planctomycetes bacterium]|nr:hypothetical protein [Planctomycetota bacterium]
MCVRAVEMEGVDLSLFQFDYDMSWHVFFLNADRTVYGRYGTRAGPESAEGNDVSVDGLVEACLGALEIHAGYPANKASLAKKRGVKLEANEIRQFPLFKSRFAGDPPRNCAHCHHVFEAVRSVPRSEKRPLSDDLMFPFAKPDRLGLVLDKSKRATALSVAPGSAADKAGFRAGDRVLSLGGQPLISIADVQWVLQFATEPCDLAAEVDRGGERVKLTLRLEKNWRRGEDILWRASTQPLRLFGWGAPAPDEREQSGAKPGELCVRVTNLPPNGPAYRAGLRAGDMIVAIDGDRRSKTEMEWLEYLYQERVRGQEVTFTVMRAGKREKFKVEAP